MHASQYSFFFFLPDSCAIYGFQNPCHVFVLLCFIVLIESERAMTGVASVRVPRGSRMVVSASTTDKEIESSLR